MSGFDLYFPLHGFIQSELVYNTFITHGTHALSYDSIEITQSVSVAIVLAL